MTDVCRMTGARSSSAAARTASMVRSSRMLKAATPYLSAKARSRISFVDTTGTGRSSSSRSDFRRGHDGRGRQPVNPRQLPRVVWGTSPIYRWAEQPPAPRSARPRCAAPRRLSTGDARRAGPVRQAVAAGEPVGLRPGQYGSRACFSPRRALYADATAQPPPRCQQSFQVRAPRPSGSASGDRLGRLVLDEQAHPPVTTARCSRTGRPHAAARRTSATRSAAADATSSGTGRTPDLGDDGLHAVAAAARGAGRRATGRHLL